MSLSSLIVQREVASIRQVEEALARQVLYGGDLVTNLLEVAQVPESILVPLLAEALGMAPAPVGALPLPTAAARELVPEEIAARRGVAPMALDAEGRLVLAVSEPLGRDDLEELSFALGVRLDERIAPAVRIREAHARDYGLPLERRMARLLGRLSGADVVPNGSLPPVGAPVPGARARDLPRLDPPGMPRHGTLRMPEMRGGSPIPPITAGGRRDRTSVIPSLLRESRPPPDVRRRGPITLDRLTEQLPDVDDREALLGLFFDFARQFFEYSAVFVVHGDLAEGRDAYGPGAPRERVIAVGVPLDLPSALRTVRERVAPLCFVPEEGGLDAVLAADLRRSVRYAVLVVPIVVRSRVVAFFVADDGDAGINQEAEGEVIAAAALVGREFERLIVRSKLQGGHADPKPPRTRASVRPEPRRSKRDPVARDAAVQVLEKLAASQPPPRVSSRPAPGVVAPSPLPLDPGSWDDDTKPFGSMPPMRSTYGTIPGFPPPTDSFTSSAPPARRDTDRSELTPPPPQAAAVRHSTGPPIPREEPPDDALPVTWSEREADATDGEGVSVDLESLPASSTRFASRPPPADLRQARLLRDIDALTAQFEMEATPSRAPAAVAGQSGQSIAVAPHLPPTSRRYDEPLPSVIVDVTAQVDLLVSAFLASPKDEQLEAELLRLGQEAMPSIMKVFPGPITITRATLDDTWPRATECGPVLRLIAGQRRVALPFVLARTTDANTESRFWATYLLTELAYAEATPAVVARLFDDSKRVRRAARLVAHVLAGTSGAALAAELDRIVRDAGTTVARRVVTLDALGEMRDPLVVPILIKALSDGDEDVAFAARRALIVVSRQDFGTDGRKWVGWWNGAAARHRIEWLIDALGHEVAALRRAAGQELKALTEEYFGYYDDLPRKDRDRAQQLYRDWWKREGQQRFRRA